MRIVVFSPLISRRFFLRCEGFLFSSSDDIHPVVDVVWAIEETLRIRIIFQKVAKCLHSGIFWKRIAAHFERLNL